MCHLILIMPVLALPVFWLWPLYVSLPVYAAISALTVWFYVRIWHSMKAPPSVGREAMLHRAGAVVEVRDRGLEVRIGNELWSAVSTDPVRQGDRVQVTGSSGLVLTVRRVGSPPPR